jgi:hypothetical protein
VQDIEPQFDKPPVILLIGNKSVLTDCFRWFGLFLLYFVFSSHVDVSVEFFSRSQSQDDSEKRKVSTESGLKLATNLQMFFIETSARTGEECRRAFAILMEGALFI